MAEFFWSQIQNMGPSARAAHGATYDPARAKVVLFGGLGTDLFGDTWELTGKLWTQVEDTGPAPRAGCGMVFDEDRGHVILFGGASAGGLMGDTWRWDGSKWTQVADTGPSPRSSPALAYHAASERIVLFGGRTATGPDAETWGWDGHEWTQLADTGPLARQAHAMSSDVADGRVMLFGGADSAARGLGDTWGWDGVFWTQLGDTGPSPRAGAAMSVVTGNVTLFGGVDSLDTPVPPVTRTVYSDTWQWVGASWSQVQHIGPSPRWLHTVTVDAEQDRLVLFGGMSEFAPITGPFAAGLMRDTWSHIAEPDGDTPRPDPAGAFALTSPTITEGGEVPSAHACTGQNRSPQLVFSNPPAGTMSFAVVLTDLTNDLVHWAIYDIPSSAAGLPADIGKVYAPPEVPGAHQTDSYNAGVRGYAGPCPPGEHTYEFKVYALATSALPAATMNTTREQIVLSAASNLGSATLTATFAPF